MRRARAMSLAMMVTRFAWIAHWLVSSKRLTRNASDASWRAPTAEDWKRMSGLKPRAISRTSREKGSLRIRRSVDFWNRRISRSATIPGRKRWGFLTPPEQGRDLRAIPVFFWGATCLSRMSTLRSPKMPWRPQPTTWRIFVAKLFWKKFKKNSVIGFDTS